MHGKQLKSLSKISWKPFSRLSGSRGIHQPAKNILCSRGNGVFGALGNGGLTDSMDFSPVVDINDSETVVNVSSGWGHSAAVTESGKLYIWGRPYDFSSLMRINRIYSFSKKLAQIVAHSSNSGIFGKTNAYLASPTVVEGFGDVSSVSCSAGLSVFATHSGEVYAFGLNRWSQCGVAIKDMMHIYQPAKVPMPPAQKVIAGLQHCVALTQDQRLYIWGKGSKGQLGLGETENVSTLPREVPVLHFDRHGNKEVLKVKDICAGFAHTAAVTEDGAVYVWGKGMSETIKNHGKGLIEVCEDQWIPRRIQLPGKRLATNIYSSNFCIVILASDQSLWAMGMGEHDRNAVSKPVQVQSDFLLTSQFTTDGKQPSQQLSLSSDTNAKVLAGSFLKNGHKRVSLHTNADHMSTIHDETSSENNNSNSSNRETGRSFDIILHNREAYLKPIVTLGQPQSSTENAVIVDYSSGWQHDLVLLRR